MRIDGGKRAGQVFARSQIDLDVMPFSARNMRTRLGLGADRQS
jgi:hypothetical protein